jgi:hypothetical protein
MTTAAKVPDLTWYIQGHTFTFNMIVLDLLPYDAILVNLGVVWAKSRFIGLVSYLG